MVFAFGWLLFGCRDLLPSFGRRWKSWLASGMCATAAYLYVVIARPIADRTLWHLASVGLASIAIWLLVFGIVGLFVRHMDAPRPLVRYFSDASYWIYLVHLAPVVWGVGLLARATAPAIVKFGLVLGFTTVVTTITYHYLVRSTAIGALLNGRRYARSSVAGSRFSAMGSKF
jgi:membrane-bound acyltransferase YfiQ involved in biofilm formation